MTSRPALFSSVDKKRKEEIRHIRLPLFISNVKLSFRMKLPHPEFYYEAKEDVP
jgi:hypothetical protein